MKIKVKKNKVNNFLQSHTIAHLNEFRRMNKPMDKTVNICTGHAIHHTPLFFILQSLLNSSRLLDMMEKYYPIVMADGNI